MSSDLHVVLAANKKSYAAFNLLGLLEKLNIYKAIFVHQDDVHDFVERHIQRVFGNNGS